MSGWVGFQKSNVAMRERRVALFFKEGSTHSSKDEWLGPESHMPNLSREFRRRGPRRMSSSFGWIVGGVFAAGVAAGYIALHLFDRQFRASILT